jgi:hypothetical protein
MTEPFQPLILRPKKSSGFMLLGLSVMFVVVGVWLAMTRGGWVGYVCAGFFSLGIPVAIAQLLPGGAYLKIAEEGFTYVTLFRPHTTAWRDVERFFVVTIKQTGLSPIRTMVGFDYAPHYARAQFARNISSSLAQCEGGLPDTYGLKAEQLVDLLNDCLERFGEQPPLESEPPS